MISGHLLIRPPPLLAPLLDQVIEFQGSIREKPDSEDECRAYLASYASHPATTVTSVVVTHTATRKQVHATDIASQAFLPIPREVVTAVLAKGDVLTCAGGFMIDEPLLEPYLGKRVGTAESIMGLPVHLLPGLLREVQEL